MRIFRSRNKPISRPQMMREFFECFRELRPNLDVIELDNEKVTYKLSADHQGSTTNLHKLFLMVEDLDDQSTPGRKEAYLWFLETVLELAEGEKSPLTPEDRGLIIPQIIVPEKLQLILRDRPPGEVPGREFYETGLFVVYALDYERAIRYVSRQDAEALQLDEEDLYQAALELARLRYPREVFDRFLPDLTVSEPEIWAVDLEDYQNSSVLMLGPEYLEPEREFVAVLPDHQTILWGAPPVGGNWDEWRTLATEYEDPFIASPFLVSSEGIRIM